MNALKINLISTLKRADDAEYGSDGAKAGMQHLQSGPQWYQAVVSQVQSKILVVGTALVQDRKTW